MGWVYWDGVGVLGWGGCIGMEWVYWGGVGWVYWDGVEHLDIGIEDSSFFFHNLDSYQFVFAGST